MRCYPPGSDKVVTVSTEGKLAIYDVNAMRKFDLEIASLKPVKSIKSKSRLLCLAINQVGKQEKKKGKKEIVNKKKKRISKDERKILKRQRQAAATAAPPKVTK